ncbi:MAG TPA: hypothetical protein VND21_09790 [Planctomycetota bacterium]|nr:hypothetical protein [Planctomycetota bacterium]
MSARPGHRAARRPGVLLAASTLLLCALPASAAPPEKPPGRAFELPGVLRGATLTPPSHFRWTPRDEARHGSLGSLEGSTREFEQITVEFGADRSVLGALQRSGFEAYRIRHDVERGEAVETDVKPDGCVVRLKNPFRDGIHASAVRTVGRTVVWARGSSEKRYEAALVALLKSVVAGVSPSSDDADGWLPREVKATWTRVPSPDLLLVHDGTPDAARLEAVLKAVRAGHATVKRLLGAPPPGSMPVVRVTTNRDMFAFVSGRRDLREADAVHLAWAGELLVAPRPETTDAARIASEAAVQMLHHRLGADGAEPLRAGLVRQAAAAAAGASPGDLLVEEEGTLVRLRAKEAQTWYRLLMMPTLVGFLSEDPELRALDAELAVVYLGQPGSSTGKASLAAWVQAFTKWGHPDAAAEAAVSGMDPAKSDAEYWAYWSGRTDPKPTPGKGGRKGK